jgi:hypothetical protein
MPSSPVGHRHVLTPVTGRVRRASTLARRPWAIALVTVEVAAVAWAMPYAVEQLAGGMRATAVPRHRRTREKVST